MNNLPKYIDLVFCLIVLPVMALIFPVERWLHNFPWYVITVGIWLYFLYFINRIITLPLLFRDTQKRLVSISLILISVGITFALSSITLYQPKPNLLDVGIFRMFPGMQQYQQAVWSLFMIVEAFSFAIGLLTQANLQRSRRLTVEAERDKAEIALYKAQIKPHFMFNTLNSLYGLFLTHDEKALQSLEMYISMIRYISTTSQCDFVPLSEEADYIRQYVALQSLRLTPLTKININIDLEHPNLNIPPMILVTFVENCFKHGVSTLENNEIVIHLTERNGGIIFSTSNFIFPVAKTGEHLGIENCRRRLQLLYPKSHTLSIHNDGKMYIVNLCIDLSKC